MDDNTQNTAALPSTDAGQAPQLTVTDLQNLRILIDTACKRGAFAAAEMSAVGATFDRLSSFLAAVAPQPAAPETTDAPTE